MARVIKRYKNLFMVNCYTEGGHCYATHVGCDWDEVRHYQRVAKMLGETIQYEKDGRAEYSYTI